MKKIGSFFFTFIPFLLAIAFQYLAMFFVMGVALFYEHIRYIFSSSHVYTELWNNTLNLWSSTRVNTMIMIVFSLLCIGAFGLWYHAGYHGIYLVHPGRIFHPLSVIGIILLVPGTQCLSTYLVSFLASLFPQWMKAYEKLMDTAGMTNGLTVSMFFYSVLLAPIGEELLFRGVTMHQAKKVFPFWAANIMQALLFGVFHMNMIQGIYAFFLGMILGYICERGGSIYQSILFHMLFNFWGTVISSILPTGSSALFFILYFATGVICISCGFVLFHFGSNRMVQKQMSILPLENTGYDTFPPFN